MRDLLDKITFRLLIGQLLPGAFLALTINVSLESAQGALISPFGPKELIKLYDVGLRAINSAYGLLLFTTFSTILGLILQTTSNLMTANLESFRGKVLDVNNIWIKKCPEKKRKRLKIRKWVASLWYEKNIWLILLVGPGLLLFDFVSVLASKPRDLYKEIYLTRARADKVPTIQAVISDYEYSSDYFSNMAMAITAHLLLSSILFCTVGSGMYTLLYVSVVYVIVSLHYISFRIVRTSADNAIYMAFQGNAKGAALEKKQIGQNDKFPIGGSG